MYTAPLRMSADKKKKKQKQKQMLNSYTGAKQFLEDRTYNQSLHKNVIHKQG